MVASDRILWSQVTAMPIQQGVYVRLWKCATVQPRLDRVYNSTTPTQEGEYYEWHKMAVVNMYIRKTWRAERSWQMLTLNQEEEDLLKARDAPSTPINLPSLIH